MKRFGPPAGLILLLAAAALLMRGRGRLPETPEDTVTALLDAAARGDAEGYVRLLGGDARASIEQNRAEFGAEKFAASLRRAAAGVKSMAISRAADAGPNAVALDVDLVFADRNEMQRHLLAPQGGGWVVVKIDRAESRKPPVAYGAPAFEEPAPPPQSKPTGAR